MSLFIKKTILEWQCRSYHFTVLSNCIELIGISSNWKIGFESVSLKIFFARLNSLFSYRLNICFSWNNQLRSIKQLLILFILHPQNGLDIRFKNKK